MYTCLQLVYPSIFREIEASVYVCVWLFVSARICGLEFAMTLTWSSQLDTQSMDGGTWESWLLLSCTRSENRVIGRGVGQNDEKNAIISTFLLEQKHLFRTSKTIGLRYNNWAPTAPPHDTATCCKTWVRGKLRNRVEHFFFKLSKKRQKPKDVGKRKRWEARYLRGVHIKMI
jgi:hypothetical protein